MQLYSIVYHTIVQSAAIQISQQRKYSIGKETDNDAREIGCKYSKSFFVFSNDRERAQALPGIQQSDDDQ